MATAAAIEFVALHRSRSTPASAYRDGAEGVTLPHASLHPIPPSHRPVAKLWLAGVALLVALATTAAVFASTPAGAPPRFDLRLENLALRADGAYVATLLVLPTDSRADLPLADQAVAAPRVTLAPGSAAVVTSSVDGLTLRTTLAIDRRGEGSADLEVRRDGTLIERHRILLTDLGDPVSVAAAPARASSVPTIDLDVVDARLVDVLTTVAARTGRRLDVSGPSGATVNALFEDVPWHEVLDELGADGGFAWRTDGDRLVVVFAN